MTKRPAIHFYIGMNGQRAVMLKCSTRTMPVCASLDWSKVTCKLCHRYRKGWLNRGPAYGGDASID